MKSPALRFTTLDLLKAIAAQLIVLHHLAAYGPLSEAVYGVAPAMIAWFYDYGRMAVQIFLVGGGFLAARTLTREHGFAFATLGKRYVRLVLPFLAALLITTVLAALLRPWFADEAMPAAPHVAQVLAHALLLHGVLDYESLTAGAWYVAIDFQLFLLMACVVWVGRLRPAGTVPLLTLALAVASLFWFNRLPALDGWAIYFFGAYGLGALAYWAGRENVGLGLSLIVGLGGLALLVDFRGRILVAISVALILCISLRTPRKRGTTAPGADLANYFGQTSYALFLVHFPVCLLVNALFGIADLHHPLLAAVGMLLAWLASNVAAHVFHRHVEMPATRLSLAPLAAVARQWLRSIFATTGA